MDFVNFVAQVGIKILEHLKCSSTAILIRDPDTSRPVMGVIVVTHPDPTVIERVVATTRTVLEPVLDGVLDLHDSARPTNPEVN